MQEESREEAARTAAPAARPNLAVPPTDPALPPDLALRADLLAAQQALLRTTAGPVILLLVGPETAGRGETADLLNAWMDPRWLVTRAWGEPSDEERERPPFWRYWRALPRRGRVGIFLSGWYGPPILARAEGTLGAKAFDRRMAEISAFERALVDDGAVLVKCWLYVDSEVQRARLERFEADPLRRWRAGKAHWRRLRLHTKIVAAWNRAAAVTGDDLTPWHVVDADDPAYRHRRIATCVRDAIRGAVAASTAPRPAAEPVSPPHPRPAAHDHLAALDLGRSLKKERFRTELERHQGRLYQVQQEARERGISTVIVFEGWDAGGKGGAVRRVTAALDARYFRVIPIAAPTDEELAHHYLWRFWRHLSRAGGITLFDRSWYGRVLVERVEGLARPDEWGRAYDEINEFERQIVEHGTVVVKFFLHVSSDEQLRRFRERERTPYKRWKITDEDWRNREKWDAYVGAINEMVERTSTRRAPWVLVEGNDKRFARVKVVRTLADRLSRAVERSGKPA